MTDTPMCSWCRRGKHLNCTGLRCQCRETDRCAANAVLTERNERRPDDAA